MTNAIRPNLQHAAAYVQSHEASPELRRVLDANRPLVDFEYERQNRPPRFLAIVDDYMRGVLVQDICDKYGCSKHTVMKYRAMAGLPKRPKHSLGVADQIERMYRAGTPIAEIAQRLGCSPSLVSQMATRLGINRRKFGPRGAGANA
ncbi:helix-turn-helix domain-containing protein [Ancylobacter sp.]|uniref:helix-turn-helix domain-containing protein n=1 Tax=Ancylobacter sp. TaxID=1872567 RepID=UPI003D1317DA